jgi:hypothetical protein
MDDRGQLRGLVRPFPTRYIHKNPSGGGDYVEHGTVTQRLLHVVGPFDTEVVEVIRGFVPEKVHDDPKKARRALADAIVGVLLKLTVAIDGESHSVTEAGDCESPHNWPHDGARLKDAMSDAIKRCSMRLGVGLHLWTQEEFYLTEALKSEAERG